MKFVWHVRLFHKLWSVKKFIPPQFSQRWSWHINTYWLAGWLKEKQERARANTGFSVCTATPSLHSSFQHGTSLHLTMATAVYVCACVCVWGESHDFSATSLRDSRHVQMVLVLALNEVPDTESSDLIGHSDFRVAVGEKPPSQVLGWVRQFVQDVPSQWGSVKKRDLSFFLLPNIWSYYQQPVSLV